MRKPKYRSFTSLLARLEKYGDMEGTEAQLGQTVDVLRAACDALPSNRLLEVLDDAHADLDKREVPQ